MVGIWGIWSNAAVSTVEGLFNRELKCSFHLFIMHPLSLSRAVPSADKRGEEVDLDGPYIAFIAYSVLLIPGLS